MIIRTHHPLLRIASFVLGIALLGVLLFFGLIVAGALLVGACALLVWRSWTRIHARPVSPGPGDPAQGAPKRQILEGEFIVVRDEHQPPH